MANKVDEGHDLGSVLHDCIYSKHRNETLLICARKDRESLELYTTLSVFETSAVSALSHSTIAHSQISMRLSKLPRRVAYEYSRATNAPVRSETRWTYTG